MDAGEDLRTEQQRPSSRRTGSSWNRGSSAWSLGGKEQQRMRRRAATDPLSSNTAEESVVPNDCPKRGSRIEDCFQSTSVSVDPRVDIDIKKEEGLFRVKGSVETVVDPDTLYGIITDYDSNSRVFRNVDRVEVEDRGGEKIVTQYLHWKFLMWSGNYDIKMKMKSNPENRSVSYELERPGFLKIFNGSWTVEPLARDGASQASKLVLHQKALPSFFPPGPLAAGAGSYASRIMSSQVRNLLTDLAIEASEVKKNTARTA